MVMKVYFFRHNQFQEGEKLFSTLDVFFNPFNNQVHMMIEQSGSFMKGMQNLK